MTSFSTAEWPLVRVSWPVIATDDAIREVEQGFSAIAARSEKFALLVVVPSGSAIPNAAQRARIAQLGKNARDVMGTYCVADALVLPSALLRGALTAIHWLAPPSHPQRVFDSVEPAIAWARQTLERAGAARSASTAP